VAFGASGASWLLEVRVTSVYDMEFSSNVSG